MLSTKPVGRGASARKYDLLTAMGASALSKSKHDQRRTLRLITLITARYNWMRDELAVGQREIARLWSVDERTVKREMALLRAQGWLIVKRQGARGRVTEYALGIDKILEDTSAQWACVGTDFEMRLGQGEETSTVVPLRHSGQVAAPEAGDGTEWAHARRLLHAEDPSAYGAWLAALQRSERAGGRLTLRAPSRFHATYVQTHLERRIFAACQAVDEAISELRIVT